MRARRAQVDHAQALAAFARHNTFLPSPCGRRQRAFSAFASHKFALPSPSGRGQEAFPSLEYELCDWVASIRHVLLQDSPHGDSWSTFAHPKAPANPPQPPIPILFACQHESQPTRSIKPPAFSQRKSTHPKHQTPRSGSANRHPKRKTPTTAITKPSARSQNLIHRSHQRDELILDIPIEFHEGIRIEWRRTVGHQRKLAA